MFFWPDAERTFPIFIVLLKSRFNFILPIKVISSKKGKMAVKELLIKTQAWLFTDKKK